MAKTVLITGSSQGIGEATAYYFAPSIMIMKTPKITYVSKSGIYPAFGFAYESPPRIKVRSD